MRPLLRNVITHDVREKDVKPSEPDGIAARVPSSKTHMNQKVLRGLDSDNESGADEIRFRYETMNDNTFGELMFERNRTFEMMRT